MSEVLIFVILYRVCDYFDELADLNVMPASAPGDTARLIATEAPVDPENWDVISGDFDRVILPGLVSFRARLFRLGLMSFIPTE